MARIRHAESLPLGDNIRSRCGYICNTAADRSDNLVGIYNNEAEDLLDLCVCICCIAVAINEGKNGKAELLLVAAADLGRCVLGA